MSNYWVNCFVNELYLQSVESSWYSILKYVFVARLNRTRSFIRDCKTSIASRNLHDYSNQLLYQKKLYLQNVERLNASWYWTVFESTVSSKNCIRRAIDFQISSRYTICSRFVRLFLTIKRERSSRRAIDMTIRINVLSNELHLQNTINFERDMILNVKLFESTVSSKKLNLSCYWFSNTFSLYDLIWICCTTCSRLDYTFYQCQCLVANARVLDVCF